MNLSEEELRRVVAEVVKNLGSDAPAPAPETSGGPVFGSVNGAVSAAEKAQAAFQDLGLEVRSRIIDAIRGVSADNAERWARMAVAETGMGRVEDKTRKNLLVAAKTPGVEDLRSVSYTGDKGLTLVEWAPFGVVAAITPSTNPVATIISNSIGILAAGNSAVFSPHPAAKGCVQDCVRALNSAIISAGAEAPKRSTVTNESFAESASKKLAQPMLVPASITILFAAFGISFSRKSFGCSRNSSTQGMETTRTEAPEGNSFAAP
ncbi:MAG TPA: aldehyde dehydrogenase family protein, partial [Elusimicrobiales bacterium]|nr:aldehyde dehydrogenase family protein [Elusimicrobiales bacterium]